ncbi:Uncharacterised protein [Clostridium perfringens]|uniref:Uncharacterized protein n=1 Tax=Clostridium perfringens TaxID=1502 RepID=A0A2X3E3L0_CLOPF|nr:hypothetical protein [Clostridium perfringens]MBO3390410.1 hypothetical protein [Clostridium perfringens]SQC06339.1 Uncharacterised protein [Clostridium perfringens]
MKDVDILFESKLFFDGLSSTELTNLLDEFGFEYEDISNFNEETKKIKKYIQNIKINEYINKKSCVFRRENEKNIQMRNNVDRRLYFKYNEGKYNPLKKERCDISREDRYNNENIGLGAA